MKGSVTNMYQNGEGKHCFVLSIEYGDGYKVTYEHIKGFDTLKEALEESKNKLQNLTKNKS